MTDKEFRRMKRSQLIDIIYHLEKEMAEQKQTIEDLQKKLEDRTIRIQNAGSIASAALELNQLLETAQATADQESCRRSRADQKSCRRRKQRREYTGKRRRYTRRSLTVKDKL